MAKRISREPGFYDLIQYVANRMDILVSDPQLNTFNELNHIEKMSVEYYDNNEHQGILLSVKFRPEVGELMPLDEKSKDWFEQHLRAIIEVDSLEPYGCGGGYVNYRLLMPTGDDVDRVAPWLSDAIYYSWRGGEWFIDE